MITCICTGSSIKNACAHTLDADSMKLVTPWTVNIKTQRIVSRVCGLLILCSGMEVIIWS